MTITDLLDVLFRPPPPQHAGDHVRHHSWRVRLVASVGESAGRLLLGGLFVAAAALHLAAWPETVAEAAARGVPQPAQTLAIGTVVEALGGLSVMLGLETSLGALALAGLTALGTFVLDDFWRMAGPVAEAHLRAFEANLALIGAFLIVAARGGGPWSLDAMQRRRRQRP
jgi:putative oxidoreductase